MSVQNRNAKVQAVIESLERDMELLCLTGVEDKLQEGVRPTLELLKNAGIKVLNYYPLANEVAKGYSNATFRPSHPCEHSRINILQWILTKRGTYLVLKRIWNPIDFQGQRSRSPGQIFRRGDMPRFALPLFKL